MRSRPSPPRIANLNEDAFDEFNEFDSLFHLTIYRAGGQRLITDILLNLLDKVQWLKTVATSSRPHQIGVRANWSASSRR